jgi:hypothetical protein
MVLSMKMHWDCSNHHMMNNFIIYIRLIGINVNLNPKRSQKIKSMWIRKLKINRKINIKIKIFIERKYLTSNHQKNPSIKATKNHLPNQLNPKTVPKHHINQKTHQTSNPNPFNPLQQPSNTPPTQQIPVRNRILS